MSAGNPQHAMSKTFDQTFEIERDKGLVLYNQNVGRNFGGKFAAGFFDELAQGGSVDIQNLRRVIFRQSFERNQEKRLARFRRDLSEMTLDRMIQRAPG